LTKAYKSKVGLLLSRKIILYKTKWQNKAKKRGSLVVTLNEISVAPAKPESLLHIAVSVHVLSVANELPARSFNLL